MKKFDFISNEPQLTMSKSTEVKSTYHKLYCTTLCIDLILKRTLSDGLFFRYLPELLISTSKYILLLFSIFDEMLRDVPLKLQMPSSGTTSRASPRPKSNNY